MSKLRIVSTTLLFGALSFWLAGCQGTHPSDLTEIAGWKGTAPNSDRAFSFVIVSDRGGGHIPGEWAAAVKEVNLLKPDFVICVGDLIEGYTEETEELLAQWDEFDGIAKGFDAPFFYCAGNHDVTNDVMLKLYTERHGVRDKTYYSFDYRGSHFIVLNSHTAMTKPDFAQEQFDWLAKNLAAARDAEHVFVFYHHPLWENEKLWGRLRGLLDPKKTTIFNGHWHQLSQEEELEIPTYVLGTTGARIGEVRRDLGDFRMFAHVSVDKSIPTIALLPLHDVLPIELAAFAYRVRKLTEAVQSAAISSEGGRYEFTQTNPLKVPVAVTLSWEAPGWEITPDKTQLTLPPGDTAKAEFALKAAAPGPARPQLSATYTFNDQAGKKVSVKESTTLRTYLTMDIPQGKNIAIDGRLDDWVVGSPLRITGRESIFRGGQNWTGPEDASCAFRAVHDAERLYVAVDVTDDQIFVSDEMAWRNDAIEFFWDARDPQKQDGSHGERTGQVILAVPAKGDEINPYWNMGERAVPENLVVSCKPRKNGYIFELSIPLRELGVKTPVLPGQRINLEIQLDDRDGSLLTYMTSNGVPNSYRLTSAYIRCRFK